MKGYVVLEIQTFIWMTAQKRRISKWGVSISPLCNNCGIEDDITIHILCDFPNATKYDSY